MEDLVCFISFGKRIHDSLVAAEEAKEVEALDSTLGVTVADVQFMKPMDVELVRDLASQHLSMAIAEEGTVGRLGYHVLHFLALYRALDDRNLNVRPMVIVKMM